MNDTPDLSAELDAAEDIVMGRAEAVVTEWGSCSPDGDGDVFEFRHVGEEVARHVVAARNRRGIPTILVRRTVTYGPWELVNDSSPAAAVRKDGPDVCPKCGTAGCLEDKALDF